MFQIGILKVGDKICYLNTKLIFKLIVICKKRIIAVTSESTDYRPVTTE